jgi:methylated-DNA-[protein]-cysteine S-methyltransferase
MNYCFLDSPIGPLLLAGDREAIRYIKFPRQGSVRDPEPEWQEGSIGALREAVKQLRQYFAGRRTEFDLPVSPEGTPFQCAVWEQLRKIPYGETISYGELARRVGNPQASRAVGAANGANPIPIVIPCHRVIGSTGKLIGFGGGLPIKKALLDLETGPSLFSRASQ